MNPRERKAALDAAEWQITLGALAGAGLALLRLFGLLALIAADDRQWLTISLAALELVLCVVFAVQVQARRAWAAVALLVLWAVGFANSWIAAGTIIPPFALLSLLIGIGLILGVSGVYELRRLRSADPGDAPAV